MSLRLPKSIEELTVRRFTKELEGTDKTVFDLFQWKKIKVELKDYKEDPENPKILYSEEDLEFPVGYSQNAAQIIATKYFRRAGVPNERGKETSMREVANRLVGFWIASLIDEGIIKQGVQASIVYDELVYGLLAQMWAPNSPQWFNTGMALAYGIKGKKAGHFYFDPKQGKVVESEDSYTRSQASACFIVSINDTLLTGMKSIAEHVKTEMRLFRFGSGTGSLFSTLRSKDEAIDGGGTSSGMMSFLRIYDAAAGTTKSGGIQRRAAKMVTVGMRHPEVKEYIEWKALEEEKVVALGKMGYDTSFDGEAYNTVSGQNSNNSLRVTNEFMEKATGINPDDSWLLEGVVDPSVNKMVSAKNLWDTWNWASWRSADPAPQYEDTINQWHTCPAGEDGVLWTSDVRHPADAHRNKINASNPCSEYKFLDDTACNLASTNNKRFYDTKTRTYDVEGYLHLVGLIMLVLESSIHWGQFPTEEIARKSHVFRTTGMGTANTAAIHMLMGHPYDSEQSRHIAATFMSLMTGYSYYVSGLMASMVGTFEAFKHNKPYMMEVIRNHSRAANVLGSEYERLTYQPNEINHEVVEAEFTNGTDLTHALKEVWDGTVKIGEEVGFRNAQATVIAPTGTIAFAMDCEATSNEPFFAHRIWKTLAGGGGMYIANPLIPETLELLGYSEEQIKDVEDYIVAKSKIEGAPHIAEEHLPIFDTANTNADGLRAISPMGHVNMMAALTPHVSGAISKTVNLPNTATIEDFKQVHTEAWKLGIKAISLYRDACKESQPLNSATKVDKKKEYHEMKYQELVDELKRRDAEPAVKPLQRNKPVGIRSGNTHFAKLDGIKLFITVNKYPGTNSICEIYVSADREGTVIGGLLDSISKTISLQLQHGISARDIAESMLGQKYEPRGFVTGHPYIRNCDSISDLIAKVILFELGDYSRLQVKPEETQEVIQKQVPQVEQVVLLDEVAEEEPTEQKLHGERCTNCGSDNMVKTGVCKTCKECGTTTGCS
jgi:ribonucleoside-diphosphate reductase alpha chain